MDIRNIFTTGIKVNNGNTFNPAFSFVDDRLTGLSLDSDNTLCISSRGQPIARFNYDYVKLSKSLYLPSGAKNGAVLTSDESGKSSWNISKLSGAIKWNSVYAELDLDKPNNEINVVFSAKLENPSISLTKECSYAINNFELYLKNKTENGFTIYTDSPMTKQIVDVDIGDFATLRLFDGIGVCFYDVTLDRMMYTSSDSTYKTFTNPIHIDDISAIGICDMAMINGHPAIVYIADDGTNDTWRYIRANDQNGATWGTPVVLATATVDVEFLQNSLFLKVIEGKPAVFFNNETGRAKLIKSTDVDGTTWSPAINISNLTNHQILDVQLINDNSMERLIVLAKSNVNHNTYVVKSSAVLGGTLGSAWPIGATQLYKYDNTALMSNIGKDNTKIAEISGLVCLIVTENTTNSIHIVRSIDMGNTFNKSEILVTSNTSDTFPKVFNSNNIMYMLYNNYTGVPSEKMLYEFGKNSSDILIKSLSFCKDHQILPNVKDMNNIIIMSYGGGISLLKFYGNDFLINWMALC